MCHLITPVKCSQKLPVAAKNVPKKNCGYALSEKKGGILWKTVLITGFIVSFILFYFFSYLIHTPIYAHRFYWLNNSAIFLFWHKMNKQFNTTTAFFKETCDPLHVLIRSGHWYFSLWNVFFFFWSTSLFIYYFVVYCHQQLSWPHLFYMISLSPFLYALLNASVYAYVCVCAYMYEGEQNLCTHLSLPDIEEIIGCLWCTWL